VSKQLLHWDCKKHSIIWLSAIRLCVTVCGKHLFQEVAEAAKVCLGR
jgi:hypothetical protein